MSLRSGKLPFLGSEDEFFDHKSEEKPHHCHRRLGAEYLKEKWGDVDILHIP